MKSYTMKSGKYILIILVSIWAGCSKEYFIEPPDPFATQTLEADPNIITLGQGANAIKLKTNHANVIQTNEGYRIKGSVFIANDKYGDMPLSTGDFEIVKDTSGASVKSSSFKTNGSSFTITGFSRVELPHEGLLKDLDMLGMPTSKMGFKKGSEFDLGVLSWPVNPDRYYFYYENDDSNPFQADITGSKLKNLKKIAIDPTDPFVFFTCDFNGTKLGDLSDVGMAVSTQGLIPFTPLVDYGGIEGFNGNIYFTGSFPVGEYPVKLTGEGCLAFNPGETDGYKKFFTGSKSDFELGLNGEATFDNEKLDWLNIKVVLGQATLILNEKESGQTELKFAGLRQTPSSTVSDFINEIVGKDWNFLDYLMPLEEKETFYGTIGTKLSDWQMGFKIQSTLKLPGDINLDMGTSELEISSSEMHFQGEAVVGGLNRVGVKGYAQKSGDFELTGYGENSLSASSGKLSLYYYIGMDVTVKYVGGVFTFSGKFKFTGKACVTIAKHDYCASVSLSGSVSIASDGSYKVCFSIGVGKLGFDVCIHYDADKTSADKHKFIQTMTSTEIPLEMVPVENRFPADECFNE